MWPNSFVIGVGDHLVTAACDDDATAARLRTLAADTASAGRGGELVHYGVRVHPDDTRRPARAMGVVQHGSASLGRSTEPERVLDGFWRTLGTLGTPPPIGTVRLDVAFVRGPDGVVLVPRQVLSSVAPGWLRDHRLEPVLVHHVDVGVDAATGAPIAQVAAPLVGEDPACRETVHAWVLDLPDTAGDDLHLADVVAHLAADLAPEVLDPDSVERLAGVVAAAVSTGRVVLSAPGSAGARRCLASLVESGADVQRYRLR